MFCNRGANGIDGTLSTAIGLAYGGKPTLLISGDLAFLHDTNGLLLAQRLKGHGHLTVLLINNQGGGEFLSIYPLPNSIRPLKNFLRHPNRSTLKNSVPPMRLATTQLSLPATSKTPYTNFPNPGYKCWNSEAIAIKTMPGDRKYSALAPN